MKSLEKAFNAVSLYKQLLILTGDSKEDCSVNGRVSALTSQVRAHTFMLSDDELRELVMNYIYKNNKIHDTYNSLFEKIPFKKYSEQDALSCGLDDIGFSQDSVDIEVEQKITLTTLFFLSHLSETHEQTVFHELQESLNEYQFILSLILNYCYEAQIGLEDLQANFDFELAGEWGKEIIPFIIDSFKAGQDFELPETDQEWIQVISRSNKAMLEM